VGGQLVSGPLFEQPASPQPPVQLRHAVSPSPRPAPCLLFVCPLRPAAPLGTHRLRPYAELQPHSSPQVAVRASDLLTRVTSVHRYICAVQYTSDLLANIPLARKSTDQTGGVSCAGLRCSSALSVPAGDFTVSDSLAGRSWVVRLDLCRVAGLVLKGSAF
jgi:hypothetical protein